MRERIFYDRVTRIYFLLSVIVVFIHASNLTYYRWSEKEVIWKTVYYVERLVGSGIGNICTPTFFLLSGFLFFRNIDINGRGSIKKIHHKQIKRVKTLLVPYLIWNSFYTIFYMFVARIPFISSAMRNKPLDFSVTNVMKGILFHEANFVFWYMATLIMLVSLSPIIAVGLRKQKPFLVSLGFIAFGGVLNYQLPDFEMKFITFYLLGSYIAVYHKEILEQMVERKHLLLSTVVLICSVVFRTFTNEGYLHTILLYATPICVWNMGQMLRFRITDFTRQSFYIYAGHIVIVTTFNKLLLRINNSSAIWALSSYFLAPMLTLIVLWCTYKIIIQTMPHFYRVICGNRG